MFLSVDKAFHGEANAGWGASYGYSYDGGNGAYNLSRSLKYGGGYGFMAGGGYSQSVTFATPPLW